MTSVGILEGSLRKASLSRAVARSAPGLAPDGLAAQMLPSPGTLPLFNQDVLDEGLPESVGTLEAAIRASDAVLIVTPEYNWSFPGVLKNAIDWLSRISPNPLEGKPVAIWSVSPGALGGARLHEGLRQVLHSQDARIMAKPEVQVALAKSKVDVAESRIVHADTEAFLRAHLARFMEFANACRSD
ncbi:NADPH-dependent FMN reductase [Oricola thermophila]|uniref:NAD(P)H-dependent oxidoreductase n=1 Tax=Oricola thermophila TaxID=2742145 RepID=A0A6N1VGX5_9HYPH|nr:NADPH-dependent FMN reductase [Oricola thermophila]QKV20161.1 NAD(P)H-dependent oxidoreductase [Oricola thermophila]